MHLSQLHKISRVIVLSLLLIVPVAYAPLAHAAAGDPCTIDANCGSNGSCYNGACIDQVTVTASQGSGTTFAQFVNGLIGAAMTVVVPVIFALAFLVFVWGVVKYLFIDGDDEAKRAEGSKFIFWGILGMVVLFSVWGFVNLLLSTLGLTPHG